MGGEDGFLLVISCLVTVLKKIRTLISSGTIDVNNYLAILREVIKKHIVVLVSLLE